MKVKRRNCNDFSAVQLHLQMKKSVHRSKWVPLFVQRCHTQILATGAGGLYSKNVCMTGLDLPVF